MVRVLVFWTGFALGGCMALTMEQKKLGGMEKKVKIADAIDRDHRLASSSSGVPNPKEAESFADITTANAEIPAPETRLLQGALCQRESDGTDTCFYDDYPFDRVITAFLRCPAESPSLLDCETCQIFVEDDLGQLDFTEPQCNECEVCAGQGVALDCSNVATGVCAIQDCNNVCMNEETAPSPTPPPVLTTRPPTAPTPPNTEESNVCFMLYQMADNNLESFIRADNAELINSAAIQQPELTTWVYFDGRNLRGAADDIDEPLSNVWIQDGSRPLDVKEEGSRYLTFDHTLGKMIVDTTLQGEQDGDIGQTVYDFVTHALTDCVARGTTEYIVAFSSHGGGFLGFGGDDNERRRLSLQPNDSIVNALRSALATVPGAPAVFDVIGFDACLMMALGVLDDFDPTITKYLLASEAVEPGHGWAYQQLSNVGSALDLARDIHTNFLIQRQGLSHRTPKTLAIVDTAKFETFRLALEDVSAEVTSLLDARNDPGFFAVFQRARAEVIAFEGALDSDPRSKSAVDIGSFFDRLAELCQPPEGSQLRTLFSAARLAYDDMFVERGVGPGTAAATGMHVFFPTKRNYKAHQLEFDFYLFEDVSSATLKSPNFLALLRSYLSSNTPTTGTSSICTTQIESTIQAENEDQLLLNAELIIEPTVVRLQSDVTTTTDSVISLYGIDLTPLLRERRLLLDVKATPPGFPRLPKMHPKSFFAHQAMRQGQRNLAEEDYFFLYSGTMLGSYEGPTYTAKWDRTLYRIGEDQEVTDIYVEDLGNGAKIVPVMYFPFIITKEAIPVGTTLEQAFFLGGTFGYLSFASSDSGGPIRDFSLFTLNTLSDTISETPLSAGGTVVPIMYVLAQFDGVPLDVILGGFGTVVLQWKEGHGISIFSEKVVPYIEGIDGVSEVIVGLIAYDDDVFDPADPESKGSDIKVWSIDVDDLEDGGSPTTPSGSAWISHALSIFLGTVTGMLLCW